MSSPKRPTLQDIADQLGITKMTVSRYLRTPDSVAPTTRDKIAQAIEASGYIRNRVPAMLSKSSSKSIGIVIPSLSNQIFADLVQGIETVTAQYGYDTLIAHTGYSADVEQEKIDVMLSYQVDGLILTETQHTARTLRMLNQAAIPIVEAMEIPSSPVDMAVGLDHELAAFEAVCKIIASGKRKPVYLAARMDSRTLLRQAGYEQAMKAAGLTPVTVSTKAHSSYTLGGELFTQAQSLYPDVDAVFCTNDDIAVGVMLHCQQHGIMIPQEMAVVGYNGLNIGAAMSPALTSVITPREAIGETSAKLIMSRLAGENIPATLIKIPHSFTDGGSL